MKTEVLRWSFFWLKGNLWDWPFQMTWGHYDIRKNKEPEGIPLEHLSSTGNSILDLP